jgi:hypothetical protein
MKNKNVLLVVFLMLSFWVGSLGLFGNPETPEHMIFPIYSDLQYIQKD